MVLSGGVPAAIHDACKATWAKSSTARRRPASISGRCIPAAARCSTRSSAPSILPPAALAASREVLRRYGNMSSATVMFVIEKLLRANARGRSGCAMSFGPGLIAETMLFRTAA